MRLAGLTYWEPIWDGPGKELTLPLAFSGRWHRKCVAVGKKIEKRDVR